MAAPADEKNVLGAAQFKGNEENGVAARVLCKEAGIFQSCSLRFYLHRNSQETTSTLFQKWLSYHALYPVVPNADSPEPKLKRPSLH